MSEQPKRKTQEPEWTPDPEGVRQHGPYHPEMAASDFDFCVTCRRRRWTGHSIECPWRAS